MAKDKKGKKGQEELGEEVEAQSGKVPPSIDDSGTVKQGGKKGKKNRKNDDWEDDIAKELEALSLENQGANRPEPQEDDDSVLEHKPKEKKKTRGGTQMEDFNEENFKGRQLKKQKGKKGKIEDIDDATSVNDQNDKTNVSNKTGWQSSFVKDSKNKEKKDEFDSDGEPSVQKNNVKGKKKGDDDDSVELSSKGERRKQKGKDLSDDEDDKKDSTLSKRKGKKGKKMLSDDDDEGIMVMKGGKAKVDKGKAAGRRKEKKGAASDSEDENIPKPSNKTAKPKSGFALLNMEEIDSGEESPMEEDKDKYSSNKRKMPTAQVKSDVSHESPVVDDIDSVKKEEKLGKKIKKKDRKKKDDDDVDKILEELALGLDGKKAPEKPKDSGVEKMGESAASKDTEPGEADDKQSKKKKKKKGDSEVVLENKEMSRDISPEAPDEELTVKSAAQKKKEKKEKEKLKRLAQYEQEQAKKTKDDKKESKVVEDKKAVKSEVPMVEPAAGTSDLIEEGKGDEDETEDKKKKKKKKKGEEEDKKDKKRPGKKQIAAMQEALKRVQEEEERLRKEEEDRIKAEEEAERLRQEKLRLEQEKKERKKQKEKEKRERLKAEGKLLTKSQRQARARMEATLAAFRKQGVEVPQIGEKKERALRLGDRKRPSRKRVEDTATESQAVEISIVDHEQRTEASKQEKEEIDEQIENEASVIDDVKDAWDESSDEMEEEDEQENSSVFPKEVESVKTAPKKAVKTQESVEESDDESESGSDSSSGESESEESSEESVEECVKHETKCRERTEERIKRRREEAEKNRTTDKLRSPVVCVLGHVDTGKTKILDKIRRTHVQDSEAGGITQQIGATMVPQDALKEQCKMVKGFADLELKVPGLLIIDTPGHESFSNLRSRGSSLCDIAVLVVDIMHGLEPQTIESLNLLKKKKTPFIVALNKVDRLYEWKSIKNKDIQDVIKSQARNTKMEFEKKLEEVVVQFATQSMNAILFYENKDPRSYISIIPTSALTGDGMGNLMALLVELTQSMMAKRLAFSEELQATVLEVKAIPGLGTTIDVILVNGRLREGDTIVLAGHEGAMVTQIRSLLMPQPLKELRVKNMYQEFKEVEASQGVKVAGKDLEKAIAGLQLLVAHHPDEVDLCKEEVNASLQDAINSIRLAERGVYVQASTLGSLEALLEFLKVSKIPYSGIRIGPVVKKDVMKASIMLEHDSQYAVILAFDVKIERDAQELADSLGVRIFQADIIYHLFDKFMAYRDELKMKKREEFKHQAVYPCKLRILPQYIFNSRDPIVVGIVVEAGVVRNGTPLCVPSKDFLNIGIVTTIEVNHKPMDSARKGQEVCIKIDPSDGEAPKMFGRHFDHTDMIVSKISRQSIDVCKEYFRDDLQKSDWQLMVDLKKIFQIM